MMALHEISQIYACASECEIWDQPVDHAVARGFVLASTRFLRGLGEAQDSELWRQTAALLRRCRRLVCTVPLPFGHPVMRFEEDARVLAGTAARLDGIADPGHIERLLAATGGLQRLIDDGADPLGDCARDFLSLDDPRDGIVILPDRVFTDEVAIAMADNGVTTHVGTHTDIVGQRIYNSAVVVGPPTWIRAGLLNAPRIRNLALVHYDVFRENLEVQALLSGPAISTQVIRPIKKSEPFRCGAPEEPHQVPAGLRLEPDADDLLSTEECAPAEEIKAAFPWYPRSGERRDVRDHVEAHAAVLADGSHVLLPTDSDARILKLCTDDPSGIRVGQISASSAGPGDYLALRNRSYHQDLLDRANAILGPEAGSLRAAQADWKEKLWLRTEEHPRGLRGVADELRSRGAATANVSYWVSSWCIRPRSKDDLAVVLRYLAVGTDINTLWEQLRRINSAHHSAGKRYAGDLQRALTAESLEQLFSVGWCTVRPAGADSPTLIARIDDILQDTLQIPLHALCRLRTTEDH